MNATKGRFTIKNNVRYVLKDKDGKVKSIFQPNKIGSFLIKHRLISPKLQIPYILGNLSNSMIVSNIVTNTGKAGVAGLINGVITNFFEYIAIGTGTTAAALGDTALEAEISSGGGSRASATASRITTDVTNDTARLVVTFNFTSSFAVTESGVLDSAASGVLLARQVFSAINVANGDSLQVTWDFDVD